MPPVEAVLTYADAAARRVRRLAWAEAVAVSVAALAVVWLAALVVALATGGQPWVRWGAVLASFGVVAASWYTIVRSRVRQVRSPRETALLVEAALPELRNDFDTVVEYSQADRARRLGVSTELVEAAARRCAEVLRAHPASELFQPVHLGRATAALAASTLTAAALGLTWPGLLPAAWDRLWNGVPPTSAKPSHLRVAVAARDIRLRYAYPAYTGMPPHEVRATAGDIRAVTGTIVEFRARPVQPAARAEAVFDDGTRKPLQVGKHGLLEGRFEVRVPARWHIELVTPAGDVIKETRRRTIEPVEDAPPEVTLLSPAADLELRKDETFELSVRATDDYGIDRIELVAQVRGPGHREVRRKLTAQMRGRVSSAHATVAVADLGAQPGDVVDVWVEATDFNTTTGPGVGRSETRAIEIWSPEKRHRELLDALTKIVEAMLDLLADRLESPVDSEKLARFSAITDSVGAINARTAALVDALASAAGAVAEDPLMPPEALTLISEMRDRHDTLRVAEAAALKNAVLHGRWNPKARQDLAVLARFTASHVEALEKDIFALEDLIDRLRQKMLADKTRQLADEQRELMDLIDKLRNGGDPEALAKALDRLDALEAKLQDMMRQLAKQAKEMPYDNFNPGALDPEGTQEQIADFQKMLEEIRRKLREGDVEGAMKLAEQMQQQISDLQAAMDEGFEGVAMSGGSGLSPHDRAALRRLQQGMREIERDQRELMKETEQTAKEIDEETRKALEQAAKAFIEKQIERARKAIAALDRAKGTAGLDERDRNKLEEARSLANELRDQLEQRRLSEALEQARATQATSEAQTAELDKLSKAIHDIERAKNVAQAARDTRKAAQLAKEIADDLDKIRKAARQRARAQRQEQMRRQQRRQAQLRRKVVKLAEQSAGQCDNPGLSGMVRDALGEVDEAMKRAEERLGEGQPRPAVPHQQEALAKLGQMRKRTQQMLQPRMGRAQGPGFADDHARIPKPDEYQVPKEFREQVIEAMKEKAPPGWRDAIEHYYEELVK